MYDTIRLQEHKHRHKHRHEGGYEQAVTIIPELRLSPPVSKPIHARNYQELGPLLWVRDMVPNLTGALGTMQQTSLQLCLQRCLQLFRFKMRECLLAEADLCLSPQWHFRLRELPGGKGQEVHRRHSHQWYVDFLFQLILSSKAVSSSCWLRHDLGQTAVF